MTKKRPDGDDLTKVRDEIDQLGDTFNQMADEIERHVHEQEERSYIREKAIIDERERIALIRSRRMHLDSYLSLFSSPAEAADAYRAMLRWKGVVRNSLAAQRAAKRWPVAGINVQEWRDAVP